MKTIRLMTCWLIVLLILGAGCQQKANDLDGVLNFNVQMVLNSDQECHLTLGVRNEGQDNFAGDEQFHGTMELRPADGDSADELLASVEVFSLGIIESKVTEWPAALTTKLDAGSYILTWGAEGYGETTMAFDVIEREGYLYLEY